MTIKRETIEDINAALGDRLSIATESSLVRLTLPQLIRMREELAVPDDSIPVWPDGERVSQLTFDILRKQFADTQRAYENAERMLETEREIRSTSNA